MTAIESWARACEDDGSEYDKSEVIGNAKIKTTFKVIHKKVTPSIAARRKWLKFGESKSDGDGPQLSTTSVCDPVNIEFLLNRMGHPKEAEINIAGGEEINQKNAAIGSNCRICKVKNDHWSVNCPYKNNKDEVEESLEDGKAHLSDQTKSQKYVPLHKKRALNADDTEEKAVKQNKVRISNLPEEQWPDLEQDIRGIFDEYGSIIRFSMPKSKRKTNPDGYQGFAYITYEKEENAMAAVQYLNGYKYFHLILKVELSAR